MRAVQHELASCNNLFPPRSPPLPRPLPQWRGGARCSIILARKDGQSLGARSWRRSAGSAADEERLADVCVGQTGYWVTAEHRSFSVLPLFFFFFYSFFLSSSRIFRWFFSLWLIFFLLRLEIYYCDCHVRQYIGEPKVWYLKTSENSHTGVAALTLA